MDFANQLILFLGALFLLSIVAGVISSRVGAPLLLVFLGLGMLLGVDGPGGIAFHDFETAFVVGSVALAIILFDGGFRTPLTSVRVAWAPAAMLATAGVVITASIAGLFAFIVFEGGWVQALLIGTIVGSTDAAAVFLLLHQRGMELKKRLSATLEVESGANDPMAIFLTITLVEILMAVEAATGLGIVERLASQFILGALIGIAGGWLLTAAVNRLELASGLYPVFVVAAALLVFGGTQVLGGSGFLAVYLAGIVSGNRRLRASKLIRRFHDGIAWVSQIVMFIMLGLLVTPTNLLPDLIPAVFVALVLMFVARPVAVYLCLLPFRFSRAERIFIAWVGLRGAVPIFLAVIPVLGGVPNSLHYFNVAFIVVLMSLVFQGWTVPLLARKLNLEMPSRPEPKGKFDIDLITDRDRDVAGYRVSDKSPIAGRPAGALTVPERAEVLTVLRDAHSMPLANLDVFRPGDVVLAICPPESSFVLDRQFVPRTAAGREAILGLGDFTFAGSTPMKALAGAYDLPVDAADYDKTVDGYLRDILGADIGEGDVHTLGGAELVVREIIDNKVSQVGLRLEPEPAPALVVKLTQLFTDAATVARNGLRWASGRRRP